MKNPPPKNPRLISKKKKQILLIEDDIHVSYAYAFYLRAAGYDVAVAHNAIEARKSMRNICPDLILLDLIMPGINGFEFLAEIKKKPNNMNIPVFIVSNLCQDKDIEKCKKLGAVEYLIKSNFFMRDVVNKIEHHLKESLPQDLTPKTL